MEAWLESLCHGQVITSPSSLPGHGRVVMLAPHPDDPEVNAVTLRLLAMGGWEMHWVVITSGWSGVLESMVGVARAARGRLREDEQRAAAARFGLPADHLDFLRLAEDEAGEVAQTAANTAAMRATLSRLGPDILVVPSGEDTNPTHRWAFAQAVSWAQTHPAPVVLLLSEDPKTTTFAPQLIVTFGEDEAMWKTGLLECHRSQSVRNQTTRGITFAERILAVNRRAASGHGGAYAERFQVLAHVSAL